MIYLNRFTLPTYGDECGFFSGLRKTCYTSYYPFGIFAGTDREIGSLTFEPLTIFYGGNGSGKTTLINVIAEKIGAIRNAPFNKSSFFTDYVDCCHESWEIGFQDSTVITSDDVFDYIFDIRQLNEGIDNKRENLFDEYSSLKYGNFKFRDMRDYEQLKKVNSARRHTTSEFVRRNLVQNVREGSNGESALMYFTSKIQQNQVYLLDEPENSLSAEYQLELLQFIQDSARFFNCQFIMATHSPFLLSAKGAKIYDLDSVPVSVKKWTELENVKKYYEFFIEHSGEF